MDETYNKKSHRFTTTSTQSTVALIEELQKANSELREARRAALNLMEDAILSKEALRQSEEKYRTKLEGDVRDRTAELNTTKDLLKTTIDSSLDMIQVFKAVRNEKGEIVDFRYVLLNKEAEKWMGDAVGESLLQRQPGVVEEGIFDSFKQVVESGMPQHYEKHYVHEQFNGWFYQSVAKMADGVATTTSNITERKKSEADILRLKDEIAQKATDKYKTLFNSVDEGFTIIELLCDDDGKVVDFIYQETNPALRKHVGMDVLGKRRSELFLDKKDFLLEKYEHLAKTGEPLHFEYSVDRLGGQWFQATAARIGGEGSKQIGVIFRNITERKQREQNQEFLLKFSDALRAGNDADEMVNQALQMLAEHFHLDRCHIGVYDLENDWCYFPYQTGNEQVPPMPKGGLALSGFPDALRIASDGTLVIPDFQNAQGLPETDKQNFKALNFGAAVITTVREGEKKPLWSIAAVSAIPREWTEAEIHLIEEVTERTWAAVQRAKAEEALRKSSEYLRQATEVSDSYWWEFDFKTGTTRLSENTERVIGRKPYETFEENLLLTHPDDRDA